MKAVERVPEEDPNLGMTRIKNEDLPSSDKKAGEVLLVVGLTSRVIDLTSREKEKGRRTRNLRVIAMRSQTMMKF